MRGEIDVADEYVTIQSDEVELGDVIMSKLGAFGTVAIKSKKGKTEDALTLVYTNGGFGIFFKGSTVEKQIKKCG